MENREQQILSEIKTMMASIRIQLEKLDAKMAELQQVVDPEDLTAMPIDLEIDDIEMVEQPVEVLEEDDLPFVETPVETPVEAPVEVPVEVPVVETVIEEPVVEEPVVEEPVVEPVVEEVVEEPAVEPTVPEEEPVTVEEEPETAEEDDDDDLPLFAEPKPLFEAAQESPKVKKAVIDVMTNREAWRTDMAGTPVRDLLSAISLNDRVQFINVLFDEDPVKFQQARAKINAMTSLDDVVAYIAANFSWDMSSQVVYRFMMAVRRKVQA
jgi:hypothetical protein